MNQCLGSVTNVPYLHEITRVNMGIPAIEEGECDTVVVVVVADATEVELVTDRPFSDHKLR